MKSFRLSTFHVFFFPFFHPRPHFSPFCTSSSFCPLGQRTTRVLLHFQTSLPCRNSYPLSVQPIQFSLCKNLFISSPRKSNPWLFLPRSVYSKLNFICHYGVAGCTPPYHSTEVFTTSRDLCDISGGGVYSFVPERQVVCGENSRKNFLIPGTYSRED